jgi:hypothetical protein
MGDGVGNRVCPARIASIRGPATGRSSLAAVHYDDTTIAARDGVTMGRSARNAEPMRGSILCGWRAITAHGYAAVYQDCRGRHGSEGEDRVYSDEANDGYDTLDWIAGQDWSNGRIGMSGSSAGATRLSPPPRRGTRVCARFSRRRAAPASTTMLSARDADRA